VLATCRCQDYDKNGRWKDVISRWNRWILYQPNYLGRLVYPTSPNVISAHKLSSGLPKPLKHAKSDSRLCAVGELLADQIYD